MKNIAPHITRQRLLIEGFYKLNVNKNVLKEFFQKLTKSLGVKPYAKPIIHSPSGQGKEINQGYDCFVPLIDSGIYLGIWTNKKFLSMVIYTCKRFNVKTAVEVTKKFWNIKKLVKHSF